MDRAALSPFPHLSWFGCTMTVRTPDADVELGMRQTCHTLVYTSREPATVRWTRRGRESRFRVDAGTVRFSPSDDADHVLVGRCHDGHRFHTLFIPPRHLRAAAASEGIDAEPELRHSVSADDAVLASCMRTLSTTARPDDDDASADREVAALSLVLRILAMNGVRAPDWSTDASVFDRRSLEGIVAEIDDALASPLSLAALARRSGMSVSHYVRKFTRSTGLSPQRFVNRRRIRRAMAILQEPSPALDDLARDVGFHSQSHFTRVFRGLTGTTPARFRRQFRRTIG